MKQNIGTVARVVVAVAWIGWLGMMGTARAADAKGTAPAASAVPLKAEWGAAGLSSLKLGEQELLASGRVSARKATFRTGDEPAVETNDIPKEQFDAATHTLTLTYPWGSVCVAYQVAGGTLTQTVSATNASDKTLQEIALKLAELKLPGKLAWPKVYPGAFGPLMAPRQHNNVDAPTLLPVQFDGGLLVACNEQPDPPATTELNESKDGVVQFGLDSGDGRMPFDDVYLRRPVAPGKTDQYKVSLRFAPANADPLVVAQDICQAYGKAHPITLHWPDRRPIMPVFPGGGLPVPQAIERAQDPNLMAEPNQVDPKFRKDMLAKADGIIKGARGLDAQGIIVWEIEGTANPHPITYIGDPRLTRWLNPQMDLVADEFFQKIREANLRTGVCLRPSRVIYDAKGNKITHSYGAAKDPFSELSDKIEYCRKRWGCSIFYVDTNGSYRNRTKDPNAQWTWGLLAPDAWRRLNEKFPDVLIIPELGAPIQYAYCGQYAEIRMGSRGGPELVRAVWPGAAQVLCFQDNDPVEEYPMLLRATINGDMFLTHPSDRTGATIAHLRQEAALLQAGAPKLPATPAELTAQLDSQDLAARYFAAKALGEANAVAAAGKLVSLLKDPQWVVRKAAVVALGQIGDPQAVAPLGELLKDSNSLMDYVAAGALARIGPPALPLLVECAAVKTGQTASAAIGALAVLGDPQAVAPLAELLKDPNKGSYQARRAAIGALAKIGGEAAVTALIGALDDRSMRQFAAQQMSKLDDPRIAPAAQAALDKEKAVEKPDTEFIKAVSPLIKKR